MRTLPLTGKLFLTETVLYKTDDRYHTAHRIGTAFREPAWGQNNKVWHSDTYIIPVCVYDGGLSQSASISFNDPRAAKFIGSIALAFILFSGGLDTKRRDIKPVFSQGIALSTAEVVLTAMIIGIFMSPFNDLILPERLLPGSIVISTDAVVVFSILKSKGIGRK